MTERKFYKTVVTVTILSEDRYTGCEDLESIAAAIDNGDDVGSVFIGDSAEIDGQAACELLYELGSDPGFFRLTDDGTAEDLDD